MDLTGWPWRLALGKRIISMAAIAVGVFTSTTWATAHLTWRAVVRATCTLIGWLWVT